MADDLPTNEALVAILEMMKTQLAYLRGVHRSCAALYEAVKQNYPDLAQKYQTEMDRPQSWLEADVLLRNIDALLQQLRK